MEQRLMPIINQNDYELIEEALTDLSNKYNNTLINRQIGRLLAHLDNEPEVTHSFTEV